MNLVSSAIDSIKIPEEKKNARLDEVDQLIVAIPSLSKEQRSL